MEYIKTLSVQKIDEYIDVLTSKIYSVLPLYEEHCSNIELNKKDWKSYSFNKWISNYVKQR